MAGGIGAAGSWLQKNVGGFGSAFTGFAGGQAEKEVKNYTTCLTHMKSF